MSLRQLPNSEWLQDYLEEYIEVLEESIEFVEDKKREWMEEQLEMMNSVLEKCAKIEEGEPIYFTKKEWNCVYGFFERTPLDLDGSPSDQRAGLDQYK
jgi:hypothetical protein